MAGKKGRSGPPGNSNNVQNPWRSFWARKALRDQDKWILPALRRYLDEAIEDAGGDDISSGKNIPHIRKSRSYGKESFR